ncbi:MAG: DEAD/DEAH box helicase, partial [Bifidobacterium sp.]|nr:DEAD/DEAH box helicase [Bifidobacterium sp.]
DFREFMTLRMRLTDLERNDRRRIKHEPFASEQERRQAMRELDRRIAHLRQAEQQHPCRQCPDLQRHLTWGHRWARETRELERVRHRYESRTGSVARQFDRICGVLDTLGYLERAERNGRTDYRLTQAGQLLRHLYSELDLTVAQALREGVFDGLNPSQMAAVASALVYEARRGNGGEPRHYPGGHRGAVAQAAERLRAIAAQVSDLCEDAALEEPRQLDFGLTDVVYEWAEGEGLYRVLYGTELTGGDFVRNAKRLADLLQQIAVAEPYLGEGSAGMARTARLAMEQVNRGIVAYSGVD